MGMIQRTEKQTRRKADQWRQLITEWKSSGMTRRAWCQEQGIAYESLRRWTKRLRSTPGIAKFVEIKGTLGEAVPSQLRVKVNRNGDVEIYGDLSDEILRRVLRVVREAAHVH